MHPLAPEEDDQRTLAMVSRHADERRRGTAVAETSNATLPLLGWWRRADEGVEGFKVELLVGLERRWHGGELMQAHQSKGSNGRSVFSALAMTKGGRRNGGSSSVPWQLEGVVD
jgi:hypothetical protein